MTADVDGHKEQLEAAAKSVAAKLQSFRAGLAPNERQLLALALHHIGAQTGETAGDTTAHMVPGGPPLAGVVAVRQLELRVAIESVLKGLGLL